VSSTEQTPGLTRVHTAQLSRDITTIPELTMLHSIKELEKYRVGASDGVIGEVKDLYFDDADWVIRYLVVSTGAWLAEREVLISPYSIGPLNHADRIMPVRITREQVENSPAIDTDKPVSRQHESGYLGYYGYPAYWGGTGLWGAGYYPGSMLGSGALGGSDIAYTEALAADERNQLQRAKRERAMEDPHLRSCNTVKGYHVHATDGDIGHVQGFLVDEQSWALQYLIINTSNWWLGNQVLVAPTWIEQVSWSSSKVTVNFTRQQIKDSPSYNEDMALDRRYEESLHRYYARDGYWRDEERRAVA
jgi:sporulation protein YlmC with PRC-barrel domain